MPLKITKTKKYKELDFGVLLHDGYEDKSILTPNGFQKIKAFQFIKRGKTLKISTTNGIISCDPYHRFLIDTGEMVCEKFAVDLIGTDKLIGYDGERLSFTVHDGNVEDLYDIEIEEPHWYFTSGVVSHNSVMLVNNAISSLKSGKDVLFITFEMDVLKTALRAVGTATGIRMDEIHAHQEMIRRVLSTIKHTTNRRLLFHEMAPDECSVAHIYALLDSLKRREGWHPDVIVLDYMDLMISRNAHYNKDDYGRQKHVANEIRGLAKNENVLVFTATQTNRSGAGEGLADLTKVAESFGKQFSLDYIISLNQTHEQRTMNPPVIVFFIAKNRNGPKHSTIQCTIDYDTMVVRER